MENNLQTYRVHRVGTITAGMSMILFGVLLFLHTFFEMINYRIIFSLWPLILIGLGIELLLSNFLEKTIMYDKTAVFLLVFMVFFVVAMAVVEVELETVGGYYIK